VSDDGRVYRFEPLDTSGVFLGLGVVQCVLLGLALVLGAGLLNAGAPPAIAAAVPGISCAACFVRVGHRQAWEWLPVGVAWVRARGRGLRWLAPIPLVGDGERVALPPCLHALVVRELPWRGGLTFGAVHDPVAGTLTALVRAVGPQFVIEPRPEQERLLGGWAAVLNQFAVEGGAVTHLTWSDFARRSGLDEHRAWLAERRPVAVPAEAAASYEALLAQATVAATAHDVVVSVTVSAERLRGRRRDHAESDDRLVRALVSAVEALLRGLQSASLAADDPLTPAEVARLLRERSEPEVARPIVVAGRLVDRLGLVDPSTAGPLAVEVAWDRLRVERTWHRTWWIASWPRLAVPPGWLEPFLAGGGMTRAVTVVFRPVAPHQSRRRIERDLVKLESDAATKQEKGRRVDARHRRATQALLEREEELVGGHAEMAYAGLVTLAAADEVELDEHGERLEQLAREAGIELRCLHGRQDTAWASALPLGLAPGSVVA
jgi:hypothetical protein